MSEMIHILHLNINIYYFRQFKEIMNIKNNTNDHLSLKNENLIKIKNNSFVNWIDKCNK